MSRYSYRMEWYHGGMEVCKCGYMFLMYIIHIYLTHCHPFPAIPQHAGVWRTKPCGVWLSAFLDQQFKGWGNLWGPKFFLFKINETYLANHWTQKLGDLIGKLLRFCSCIFSCSERSDFIADLNESPNLPEIFFLHLRPNILVTHSSRCGK